MSQQFPPQQPFYQPPPREQAVKTYTSGFGGSAEKKFSKDAANLLLLSMCDEKQADHQ